MDLTSKPEVFIIESLKFDEEKEYREGEMIFRSLTMSLKKPQYRYIRTQSELEHFLEEFQKSNYRYLHVSCHGSKSGVSTTLDDLTTETFAEIVGPYLSRKRLFLSTCLASTQKMAEAIFQHSDAISFAGPLKSINFDDSVIMWTSFYHLMFKQDAKRMNNIRIRETLAKCAELVEEKVNFFIPASGGGASRQILPEGVRKLPIQSDV